MDPHSQGSDGIAHQSVRHTGGERSAVFRPRPLANCRQEGVYLNRSELRPRPGFNPCVTYPASDEIR